jgi:truncated hemoglobin YjbI
MLLKTSGIGQAAMTERDWILHVVHAFYQKAKDDVLIGYHFRIIKDFDTHIPRIATFWDLQLLGSTLRPFTEPFDVMKVHIPLQIKRGELGRWLLLFRKTLDEETASRPEFTALKELWLTRLKFFEGVFLRFFGFE